MATPGTNGHHGTNDQVVKHFPPNPREQIGIAKQPITKEATKHIQKADINRFFQPRDLYEPDAANEKSNNEIRPIAAKNNH